MTGEVNPHQLEWSLAERRSAVPRVSVSIAVLVLLLACGSCAPPSSPEAVRSEVQQVVRAYVDAANRADVTVMMEMMSRGPGASSINDGSITRGWDAIRTANDAVIGKVSSKMTLGSIDVLPLGGANALVIAPVTITVTTDEGSSGESGATTLVLEKSAKGWKIIHEHYSSQPEEQGE
jgi:uncharacterized protein (TIGR02246 family)